MGGDLSAATGTGGPTFLLLAVKDPQSAAISIASRSSKSPLRTARARRRFSMRCGVAIASPIRKRAPFRLWATPWI